MRKTLLVATMAVASLFASCSKNDDNTPDGGNGKTTLLTKITEKNGNVLSGYTTFTYDNDNRLVVMSAKDEHGITYQQMEFVYDNLDRVSKIKVTEDDDNGVENFTLTYVGNKVNIAHVDGIGAHFTAVFTLDGSGRVVKTESVDDDEFSDVTTYTYDSHGNVTQIINSYTYSYPEPVTETYTELFKYDNKRHPLSVVATTPLLGFLFAGDFLDIENGSAVNNATEITVEDEGNNYNDHYYVTNTYNDAGFPIKITHHDEEHIFEYTVK